MPTDPKVPVALLLATLALPSIAPGPLRGQGPPTGIPDLREAERERDRAIDELEEIAGRRTLRQDPPPLPELPPLDLSPEETALIARLAEADPAGWRPEEREALAVCLARNADALAALGARGEVPDGHLDGGRMLRLLATARLRAVGDRLAYLEGREGEALSGLETRLDLARRLALQPGAFGSIVGEAVYLAALPDVQRLATRPETPRATLEHLDALLGQRQAEVPDPAAVLAREALSWVDAERRLVEVDDGALAGDDPHEALFTAPLARDAADLARRCRELGCREAIAALERRDPDDPYGVIAGMFLPNFLDMLMKLEGSAELTRLARTAVVLRLEALETGGYPDELTGVALDLGLSPEEAEEMVYERSIREGPDGPGGAGARLRLASDRVVTDAIEQRREALRPLLTWDLPPVPAPPDPP